MGNRRQFLHILPLFMVVFFDILSGTLLLPLLPKLFINGPSSIVSPDISAKARYFLFGFSQAIFFIALFFSSPILGDLADRIGRKKVLIISLLGAFIGYLLSVASILFYAVSLLLLGRFIAGFTAGSLSAAQAAVIDVSTDESRTVNIGYILLALSLASIFGPLISGILSNSHWVSWFGLTTPLYAAALLSLLNVIYLCFGFKETYKPTYKPIKLFSGLTAFASAFMTSSIRGLALTFLFVQLGWATFVQFISLFLALRYHFNPHEIGIYMALIGLGSALAFCYLLTLLTGYFSSRHIALGSISLILLIIFAITAINNVTLEWVLSVPVSTSLSIAYSVLISLFSETVGKDKQGWVMGIAGAITAFAFGISGLIAGILVNIHVTAPLWLSFVFFLISMISICLTK